jgi:hypothetical protein
MPDRDRTIIAKYPDLFDLDSCPIGSSMHLGLQVDAGWLPVIERMCERLEPLVHGTGFRFQAIKQDMGTLRAAYRGGNEAVRAVIEAGATEAAHTCEMCGNPGILGEVSGWWAVRCAACAG